MIVRAIDVISPTNRWKMANVLIEEKDWSVAEGCFDDRDVLVMRWNGTEDKPKGNPVSTGHPTWFVLPDEFRRVIKKTVDDLIKEKQTKRQELVKWTFSQPQVGENKYDPASAYHCEAKLTPLALEALQGSSLQINLTPPSFKNKTPLPWHWMITDKGYSLWVNLEMLGVFKDGKWECDLYSNGVPEKDNPVTKDDFKNYIIEQVEAKVRPLIK